MSNAKNENSTPVDAGAEAEKILAEAREQADKLLADAEKQAKKTTAAAKEEAEGIVAAAEKAAKETTDAAEGIAERIVAAAEAEAEKPAGAPDPAGEELVEYTLPLLAPEKDQTVFVGVNGKTIRIRRGVPVKIPRKFVEVLEHTQRQEMAAYQAMEAAAKQSAQPAMNL